MCDNTIKYVVLYVISNATVAYLLFQKLFIQEFNVTIFFFDTRCAGAIA